MNTFLAPTVLTAALLFLSIVELPNSPLRLGFVGNAEAIIGMPWTPYSCRGHGAPFMYAPRFARRVANAAAREAAANAAAAQGAAANAAATRLPRPTLLRLRELLEPLCPLAQSSEPASGCNSRGGVNYFNCAGVYYRAGFQGNNIVYIVSAP